MRISDWSLDVCSSDLHQHGKSTVAAQTPAGGLVHVRQHALPGLQTLGEQRLREGVGRQRERHQERRDGKTDDGRPIPSGLPQSLLRDQDNLLQREIADDDTDENTALTDESGKRNERIDKSGEIEDGRNEGGTG